ncbi:MAG: PAS domain-containing protein, partial [Pricia sp.]|nr:PAS domain-containing protein [Pricia sp.]
EDYIPNLEEGINFYKEGEHREEITRLVSEAISDGTPWDTELIIVTAKGNELWVRAKGEVENVNGQCVRIYGTFQDIDEKKKAQLDFLTITERLAVATKGANVGIWDYNITHNDLVWDDNMYRLYGIKKEDFKGEYEAWHSGLHPDDRECGMKEIEMAISGEKEFDTEFRVIWPNGEIRHIRAIAVTERDADGRGIKMIGTNWDITELKTAQMNLIKSEESFEGAFENSTIGMAQVGLKGEWLKVNRSLCESLGYTEKEFRKMTFQEMTYPEDLDKDLALLGQVFKSELKSYQIEKRYIHKKGHIVHAMLTVTAVRDIDGKLSHFISQVMDVSSIVQAELKYKETSERLNMATSVANIGIWDYRIEENLVICNENMHTIYDIPKDSSNVKDDWMKRVHPEDQERIEQEIQATIADEKPFNTQFRGVKPNGEIIHVVVVGEAQKNEDGKITKIVGANWDISELKNAKAMLENSKESFQNSFENATIGMAIMGLDNRWLKVNKSLSKSLGYSEKDLLKLSFQDITHSEDMDKSRIMMEEVYTNKRDSYQIEKRYIHKNGQQVPVLLNVTAVKDLEGNLSHTITQILDLTDKKEAEKSLNALVKVT